MRPLLITLKASMLSVQHRAQVLQSTPARGGAASSFSSYSAAAAASSWFVRDLLLQHAVQRQLRSSLFGPLHPQAHARPRKLHVLTRRRGQDDACTPLLLTHSLVLTPNLQTATVGLGFQGLQCACWRGSRCCCCCCCHNLLAGSSPRHIERVLHACYVKWHQLKVSRISSRRQHFLGLGLPQLICRIACCRGVHASRFRACLHFRCWEMHSLPRLQRCSVASDF